jgi:hypothetical protein
MAVDPYYNILIGHWHGNNKVRKYDIKKSL